MIEIPRLLFLLLCITAQFFGLFIFLKGFFPIKSSVPGRATFYSVPDEPRLENGTIDVFDTVGKSDDELQQQQNRDGKVPISPAYGRLVVMVIDALRADFVYGEEYEADMPYLRGLIAQRETISLMAKAHPPTVTMPRIKALTAGTIPGFIDVVLNLNSNSMTDDNLISQMHWHGKHILFYGDDTWMRLFPGHFAEADGTTSFFVTDYTEVDNNVTRHIGPALDNPKWDTLLLHYLGLDHIGHIGGPKSSLVPPKLNEMDAVIKRIHQSLLEKDKDRKLPTLFVICGDHGMSDMGSHGGASQKEIETPLVFLSSAFSNQKGLELQSAPVDQIDLVPTLSLLLGLPIPQNSIGVSIVQLLQHSLAKRDQLRALQINCHQLTQVLQRNSDAPRTERSLHHYQHAVRLHHSWLSHTHDATSSIDTGQLSAKSTGLYLQALSSMKEKVASSLVRYDVHAMGCGIIIIWQVLLVLLIGTPTWTSHTHAVRGYSPSSLLIGPDCHFMSLLIGCCVVAMVCQVIACTSTREDGSELLCGVSVTSIGLSQIFVFVCGSLSALLLSCVIDARLRNVFFVMEGWTVLDKLLILGTIVHTISLLASSFVEEEHQTWYFLTLTFLLIFAATSATSSSEPIGRKAKIAGTALLACVLSRLLRAWNQTGIKWADKPDVGDWFVRPENKLYLSILVVTSFCVIYSISLLHKHSFVMRIALLLHLVGVYWYRCSTGAVTLPFTVPSSDKGIYEARLIYALLLCVLARTIFIHAHILYQRYQKTKSKNRYDFSEHDFTKTERTSLLQGHAQDQYVIGIMLMTLLFRPHNSALAAMFVLLQHCLGDILLPWLQWKVWAVTILHVWMAEVAFSSQGNSISIATIDISAGYIGLESYNAVIAGGLTFLATYSGYLLWVLRLMVYISQHCSDRYISAVWEACYTLALCRAVPIAVYTVQVTIERYHLFVWSVFSPKLLYEASDTYLAIILTLGIVFHIYLLRLCGYRETLKTM